MPPACTVVLSFKRFRRVSSFARPSSSKMALGIISLAIGMNRLAAIKTSPRKTSAIVIPCAFEKFSYNEGMNETPRNPKANFATTQWSVVLRAGGSTLAAQEAMESLCEMYWYPLYVFGRRRGLARETAEDMTQSFFVKVFEKHYLKSVDPDRGRFRSFLLTVFKRFLNDELDKKNAIKRGGKVHHISIDFEKAEQSYQAEPVENWTAEMLYERRWALTLLDKVLGRLGDEYRDKGKDTFFRKTQVLLTTDFQEAKYDELATSLQMSKGSLRVAVHRMRSEYRELLQDEVSRTLAEPTDFQSELELLQSALRGKNPKTL